MLLCVVFADKHDDIGDGSEDGGDDDDDDDDDDDADDYWMLITKTMVLQL